MSTATATPREAPSYFELALGTIAHSDNYTATQQQDANDCLTFMKPASTNSEIVNKAASKARLVQNNPDILAPGEKLYTIYHARKLAARILSKAASEAEQSTLKQHGVDYRTAYRLSGAPNEEGILRDSMFASKKDNGYRLVHFDSRGEISGKNITEIGMRSRLGVTDGKKEKESRRKVCGTSCSGLGKVTDWIRHQDEAFYTDERNDIGSFRQGAADLRTVLQLDGRSVSWADYYIGAKARLRKSKYKHEMRESDGTPARTQHGQYEMLGSRLVADILFSRDPESDTVKSLKSRYTDLSEAIFLDCEVNDEKDLSIARGSFFFPADPETWQAAGPSDQFYDLVSIDKGRIVSVVEHSIGETVGKLRVTKSKSSKKERGRVRSGG